MNPHKFKGIYDDKGRYYTLNLVKGKSVYGERLVKDSGKEYREWDPTRSKLSAALHKKISQLGIYPGSSVLYLGASTGTTVSHVSDLVGETGIVFALDFSKRTTRDLMFLCKDRKNIAPILESAVHIDAFAGKACQVDAIVQDIAQRDQARIFLKNCDAFLKEGGFGILVVKARSIDVSKKPKQVFQDVRKLLENSITIVDYRELHPLEKDHCIYICKKK